MERVGLVVLSIVSATALLLAASYGALYLRPVLAEIPTGWVIIASSIIGTLAMLLHWRRRRAQDRREGMCPL